jgi:cell division protein FtsL
MPPLVIEVSLGLAIIASAVKVTISISSIQQSQKVAQAEVLGEIKVIHTDIKSLKDDTKELKAEVKENRKFRFSDRAD